MLRQALLLTMLLVPAAALPDDVPNDQKKIQGEWKLVRQEPDNPTAKVVMEVKGDEQWYVVDGQPTPLAGKFKLDPSKSPKHFDMTGMPPRGETPVTFHGIYELTGDRLRICYSRFPNADVRPVDFTPSKDQMLMEFERIKK